MRSLAALHCSSLLVDDDDDDDAAEMNGTEILRMGLTNVGCSTSQQQQQELTVAAVS